MIKRSILLTGLSLSAAIALSACGSSGNNDGNNDDTDNNNTSEFNPDGEQAVNTGEPGGDTTAIAGLWKDNTDTSESAPTVFWNLADNGVLIRYDYQQDGQDADSGENCYVIGAPITVTPEGDDAYSIFNVAVTAAREGDALTLTFIDADANDLDENGDTTETPTFSWNLSTTPGLSDLNACADSVESGAAINNDAGDNQTTVDEPNDDGSNGNSLNGDETVVNDNTGNDNGNGNGNGGFLPGSDPADRPSLTGSQCIAEGGVVVGDIGDGAIHRPEYRCESTGLAPIARITYLDGESIATEGAVCC